MAFGVCSYQSKKSWRIYYGNPQVFKTIPKAEFPMPKDAKKEAQRLDIQENQPLNKDMPFADFALKFFESNYIDPKSSTSECFAEMLNWVDYFLTQHSCREMRHFTDDLLLQYKAEANIWGRSHSSINRDLAYLKLIGDSAMRKGLVRDFERKRVKDFSFEPKVMPRPTNEEADKILSWFKRKEPFYYAWMYFIRTRGWRKSEFRKMLISDIEFDNERLLIRHTKTIERDAYLTKEDLLVLNEHIILLKQMKLYKPDGLLYPPLIKSKTGFISKNTLLLLLKRACQDLGIVKPITLKSFRHKVVSDILNAGMGYRAVMNITGHQNEKTIQKHYSHIDKDEVIRALKITKVDTGFMHNSMQK